MSQALAPATAPPSETSGTITGVVVDDRGRPVRARVAIVSQSGSVSDSTDDRGEFRLHTDGQDLVLHASTQDGRVAIRAVNAGASDIELRVTQGGTILVDLAGPNDARCAVFADDVRIEDFTLRPGKPATVVVPAGDLLLHVYGQDDARQAIHQDVRVHVERGATESVRVDLPKAGSAVVPLRSASAWEVARKLNGVREAWALGFVPDNGSCVLYFDGAKPLPMVRIVPDERTNSLFVQAAPTVLPRILRIIAMLDEESK